ncbi:hypothetical protein [Xanthomonas albilineans]|uniref:hypothetical protein n=1 Tax=Xanthomonas albilineans TaxID=29447 RepID=UPI000A660913|nr:hypothetical protein [Xanthomonas albilineans]
MTTHSNDSRRYFLLGTAATAIAAIVPVATAAAVNPVATQASTTAAHFPRHRPS